MSQSLELSNGTLLKLQTIANAKGVTPEEWIEAQVSEASAREGLPPAGDYTPESGRKLVGRGKYAHVPGGSEAFNEEKVYEIAREDRRRE